LLSTVAEDAAAAAAGVGGVDLDVLLALQRLAPGDGLRVLDELGQNSMAGVRNLPAYIMGICKRYTREGTRAPRAY